MTLRIVLASNNAKKLRELQSLLSGLPLQLTSQSELGIAEADEPHQTFIENALAKARHASQASGLPAIADDSGLCVALLGGDPGVESAVYGGEVVLPCNADREERRRVQDEANNQRLRIRLRAAIRRALGPEASSPEQRAVGPVSGLQNPLDVDFDPRELPLRRARFVSTLVALRSAEDPEPLVSFGRWEGLLLDQPRGQGGFGYDPYLYIPGLACSVAELPQDAKNRHSHRARAAAALSEQLALAWGLGDAVPR